MNKEERDAYREKHTPYTEEGWLDRCQACQSFYPCDTIQVLNALEQALGE